MNQFETNIGRIVSRIKARRKEVPAKRSLLVGISGIDASGKGFIAAKLIENLRKQNVLIN